MPAVARPDINNIVIKLILLSLLLFIMLFLADRAVMAR